MRQGKEQKIAASANHAEIHPPERVPSEQMTELSESAGSEPRGVGDVSDEDAPETPERPRLVALPVGEAAAANRPEPERAPDDRPAGADAQSARLTLERALRGPGGQAAAPPRRGSWQIAGAVQAAAVVPRAGATELQPAPPAPLPAVISAATPELVHALRAELAMRASVEAGLRTRAVDAETRLAVQVLQSQRTAETLRQIRVEIDRIAELLGNERARREAAERRVGELEAALAVVAEDDDPEFDPATERQQQAAALGVSLQRLRTPAIELAAASEPAAPAPGDVSPERLADALTRLRAGDQPAGPEATGSRPASETIARPLRTLCRRDRELAGRIVLSLLELQWTAFPYPIAYDLLLGAGNGCIRVTSADGSTEVVRAPVERSLRRVEFHVVGGPDRIARLLVAGRIRRGLGFGLARVHGNRSGLRALDALLGLPIDLPALAPGATIPALGDAEALAELHRCGKAA